MHQHILSDEEEKKKIQNDIHILSERLARLNEALASKVSKRNEYDKIIAETEVAYTKVTVSSTI